MYDQRVKISSQTKHYLYSFLLATATTVSILGVDNTAQAAQRVVLKYGWLRESVAIPELTKFAQTGELSSSLRAYLKMANREPEEFKDLLTKPLQVDGVFLYKILKTLPGEFLLDQVSQIVHTPSQRASRQSLRAALVSSALDDDNITLIEILENYPTADVHVEGERIADIYRRIDGVVRQFRSWLF